MAKKKKSDAAPTASPADIAAALNAAAELLGAPLVAHLDNVCADAKAAEEKKMKAGRPGVPVCDHDAAQRQRLAFAKEAQGHIARALTSLFHLGIDL